MKQLKSSVLSALVAAAVFAGCTPAPPQPAPAPAPQPPAAPKPATPAPAKPAEPAKPAAPAKPAEPAKPVELVPSGANFLYNASFETWEKGDKIAAWNLAEGFEDKWDAIDAKKVDPAPQGGSSAIELPAPGKDQTVILSQTILPGKIEPKRRLFLSAQVNSQEKEAVHMLLTYKVGEQTETIRRVSQGDASWAKLEAQFWIPASADPASFRIQFIVQKGVKNPVQLDDVRVQLMAPKGSTTAKPIAKPAMPMPQMKPVEPVVAPAPAKDEPAPAEDSKSEKSDTKSESKSDSKKASTKKSDAKSDTKSDSKSSTQKSEKKSSN